MRRAIETKYLSDYLGATISLPYEGNREKGTLLAVRKSGKNYEVTFGEKKVWAMMIPNRVAVCIHELNTGETK